MISLFKWNTKRSGNNQSNEKYTLAFESYTTINQILDTYLYAWSTLYGYGTIISYCVLDRCLLSQSIGGLFGMFAASFGIRKIGPFCWQGWAAYFNCSPCLSHTGNSQFLLLLYQ